MMMVGNPSAWTERFRSLDVRFLERVTAVWSECVAGLPAGPTEDTITINLVGILSKDRQARRLFHWLEYQYEAFGFMPNGTAYSKGRIDMALVLDGERERYLAYECKRLNVVRNGKRESLASRYVKEGLMRFVTEQYAESLPVGCMLGYVMDGDVSGAQSGIFAAIRGRAATTGLTSGPGADRPIGSAMRFFSRHRRRGIRHEIEIRHALLPFSQDV